MNRRTEIRQMPAASLESMTEPSAATGQDANPSDSGLLAPSTFLLEIADLQSTPSFECAFAVCRLYEADFPEA
jgi:hypothetical protein